MCSGLENLEVLWRTWRFFRERGGSLGNVEVLRRTWRFFGEGGGSLGNVEVLRRTWRFFVNTAEPSCVVRETPDLIFLSYIAISSSAPISL